VSSGKAWRWIVVAALLAGLLAVAVVFQVSGEFRDASRTASDVEGEQNPTIPGGILAAVPMPPKRSLVNLNPAKNPFYSATLAAVRVREREAAERARVEAEALALAEQEAEAEAARKAEEAERMRLAKEKEEAEAAKKKAAADAKLAAEKAEEEARLAKEKAAAEAAAIPPPKVVALRYQGMLAAGGNTGALIAVDDKPAAYHRNGDIVGSFRLEQITRDSVTLSTTNLTVRRLNVPAGERKTFTEDGAPHED